jgi:FAD/FMN-containing dehydrogenase
MNRKAALGLAGAFAGSYVAYRMLADRRKSRLINDVHSQLNATHVDRVEMPRSLQRLQQIVRETQNSGRPLCVAGGRHAMGGQQFASGATLVDTTRLNRVLSFDRQRGIIEVEAGIQWPELVDYLVREQRGEDSAWGMTQKQTGADRLCLGGALASNVHGRGLRMEPIISDVESFTLVNPAAELITCSRDENREIFSLAIGGYGLFGVIYSVRLRLSPRRKLRRVVSVIDIEDLPACFEERIGQGCLYGDFQYATDEKSADFLRKGVFSCYVPVDAETPMPAHQKAVPRRAWRQLVYLGHADKSRAFKLYSDYYLSTSGQLYWSDTHQLAAYLDDYHKGIDRRMRSVHATEIITELFVPRPTLPAFMEKVRDDFRRNDVNVIYGTIRLAEKDDESYLAWARESYAGVIFNLHTEHTPTGIAHSAAAFRRLIDMAVALGGSYYLTYHRYATREQVESCYPQFADFLALKQKYDPQERFQSEWYRHYAALFA